MSLRITAPQQVTCRVALPPSKSMLNRALVINALQGAEPASVPAGAECDDCRIMRRALAGKGSGVVDVGASGTALRFLTAFFATRQGCSVTLDGDARLRERPVAPLVSALRELGATITFMGREGRAPLAIEGTRLHGGRVTVDAGLSSQHVSALLLIAPVVGGMTINLSGKVVSRPYIDMTLAMMNRCGVRSVQSGNTIVVEPRGYAAPWRGVVEGDWSAAAFWVALQALLPRSQVVLENAPLDSLQGDSAILAMMRRQGVTAHACGSGVSLSHGSEGVTTTLDMTAHPDLVQTMAVTLCLLRRPFTMTGVATLALKESDRLRALRDHLHALGCEVQITAGGTMSYDGNHSPVGREVVIDTRGDHRIAMAMTLAATRHGAVVLDDERVVTKSYPQFWDHLAAAGFTLTQLD